jgi:hypothetical protein
VDEMLNELTRGIGAELGKKIRIAYYEKKKYISSDGVFKAIHSEKQPIIWDLLALSIFHEFVIGPLHGSNNFLLKSKKYGVKSINMGSYKIDGQSNAELVKITKAFFAIMKSYNIEIGQLSISSTHEFVVNNAELINKWQS